MGLMVDLIHVVHRSGSEFVVVLVPVVAHINPSGDKVKAVNVATSSQHDTVDG